MAVLVKVPVGIGAPNILQDAVYGEADNPTIVDMSVVTAVVLHVWAPTVDYGAPTTLRRWPATIVSATPPSGSTPSSLVWQHAFDVGDCTILGRYEIVPFLTVPGYADAIPCRPAKVLEVVAERSL